MLKKLSIIISILAVFVLAIYVLNNSTPNIPNNQLTIDTIRIGVTSNVYGLGYNKYIQDDIVGFEVDLAKIITQTLYGDENLATIVGVNQQTALYSMQEKKLDILVSAMTPSQDYSYTSPYYKDAIDIMYKDQNFNNISSFESKNIGTIINSKESIILKDYLNSNKIKANVIEFASYEDVTNAFNTQKIQGFCIKSTVNDFEYQKFNIGYLEYCVFASKENSNLIQRIDEIIQNLQETNQLQELAQKWNL